jgi:ATP-dependent protease ClpP protease subunit
MSRKLNRDDLSCKVCGTKEAKIGSVTKLCNACWQRQKYYKYPNLECIFCKKEKKIKVKIPPTCHSCYVKNNKNTYTKKMIVNNKYARSLGALYNVGKKNAEKRKLPWKITTEQFLELRKSSCFYCSGPLPETGCGLDRISNDKKIGYTIENVLPCCSRCNMIRSDRLSVTEMVSAMNAVRERRKESLEDMYERGYDIESRTVFIFGEINEEMAKNVIKAMEIMENISSYAPIKIKIMSPGGNWYEGLAIYEKIKNSKCPTHAIGMGLVGSTATAIFQAAEIREIGQLAFFVIHDGTEEFSGECKSFENWAEFSKKNRHKLYSIYAEKSKKPVYFWEEMCRHDTILDSNKVLELGLADFVTENKKTKNKNSEGDEPQK